MFICMCKSIVLWIECMILIAIIMSLFHNNLCIVFLVRCFALNDILFIYFKCVSHPLFAALHISGWASFFVKVQCTYICSYTHSFTWKSYSISFFSYYAFRSNFYKYIINDSIVCVCVIIANIYTLH